MIIEQSGVFFAYAPINEYLLTSNNINKYLNSYMGLQQ